MGDERRKDVNWRLPTEGLQWEHVQVAVLMDIRDELKRINQKLDCHRIPAALDAVSRIDRRLQNSGLLVDGKKAKGGVGSNGGINTRTSGRR